MDTLRDQNKKDLQKKLEIMAIGPHPVAMLTNKRRRIFSCQLILTQATVRSTLQQYRIQGGRADRTWKRGFVVSFGLVKLPLALTSILQLHHHYYPPLSCLFFNFLPLKYFRLPLDDPREI